MTWIEIDDVLDDSVDMEFVNSVCDLTIDTLNGKRDVRNHFTDQYIKFFDGNDWDEEMRKLLKWTIIEYVKTIKINRSVEAEKRIIDMMSISNIAQRMMDWMSLS